MYIVFSNGLEKLDKDGILFRRDNWDDFGFKTLFRVYINTNQEPSHYIGSVSIGTDNPEIYNTFNWLEKNSYTDRHISSFPKELFSIGTDIDYYEGLRQKATNLDELHSLLKMFNDVAYDEERLQKVKETKVFGTSFLRHSPRNSIQQFKRYINGGAKFINFNWHIQYESIKNNDEKSIYIENELKSFLPTNLNAFIGANGSGKTSLLKDIAIASNNFGEFIPSSFMKDYRMRIADVQGDLTDNVNIIHGITNLVYVSFSSFDIFSENFSKVFFSNPNFQFLSNREFSFLSLNEINSDQKLNRLINTVVSPDEISHKIENLFKEIRETNSSKKMLEKILKYFKWDSLFEKLSVALEQNLQMTDSKTNIEFSMMSSGQKMILAILFSLVHKARENSLFLIDEPELYLHPPYILSLVLAINEILKSTNSAGIMTTHSAIVLQEIPKGHVFKIIDLGNDKKIIHPRLESFGSNLSEINDEVFGVNIRDTGFYSILKNLATKEEISQEDIDSLGSDAKLYMNIIRNNNNV